MRWLVKYSLVRLQRPCQITNPLPADWPLNGSNCTGTRESLEEEDMSKKSVTIKRMTGLFDYTEVGIKAWIVALWRF